MILTVTGFLAAGLSVATAGPAAAIPGLNNVTATTAVNSNVFKSITATCPAGQVVIGGGAQLSLATGEVSITRMAPTAAGTGFEAAAYEDFDGFAGVWSLQVIAICAPAPPGYTIVIAASPPASPVIASITAACPAGRRALGTGGLVFPGRGVVLLTGIVPGPAAAPAAVTVTGAELAGGFADNWNLQAWAICANPAPGHAVAVTLSPSNSASPKTQLAGCPAGQSVHGVGFELGGGTGEIMLNAAFPVPVAPVGTVVPVTATEDQSGFAGAWSVRTHASCAL